MRRRCRKCKKIGECAKHRRVCKVCVYERSSLWQKNNRERRNLSQAKWKAKNPLRRLEHRLRNEYQFSERTIRKILAWQGSTCLCGKRIKKLGLGWSDGRIEHNHKTGKFRGITCGRCNYVLGAVGESQKLLTALKRYLRKGAR